MSHRARKRFGQNFLTDDNIIGRILSLCHPKASDHFVEIGPGLGALTYQLLNKVKHLHAIEVDRDLAAMLNEKTAKPPYDTAGFSLINQDVLTLDIATLGEQLRIIGNLPYNISTPIILHLLHSASHIQDMCFMLQKEVVERMTAKPRTKAYGRLSVILQYRCLVEAHFLVPPDAFHPQPKVTSQMVTLTPYTDSPYEDTCFETLQSVVKKAFGMRRKTLKNNLKGLLSDTEFETLNIDPTQRPETLSVQAFVTISNAIRGRK